MSDGWSSDWFLDRFTDDDHSNSPCPHRHVVPVTTGSRRFSQGEVYDDIQDLLQCTDCLAFVTSVEALAAWNGVCLEEIAAMQLEEGTRKCEGGRMIAADRKAVVLSSTLSTSQASISSDEKQIPKDILKEPIITIFKEFFYRVDFGPGVYSPIHIVSHDLFCACLLEQDCPAVQAVKAFLQTRNGETAKTPHPGYFPAVPHHCPICWAPAYYAPELSSHHRGIGWHCELHGAEHYWLHQWSVRHRTNP